MKQETVSFRGSVGRSRRSITTENGVISSDLGGGRSEQIRPPRDEWTRFWSAADSLRIWEWDASYGQMIKDGRPWSLGLRNDDQTLSTLGNGFEEHAPVGIRPFMLALNTLLGGRLLSADDAQPLEKNYRLNLTMTKESKPPISELTLLRPILDHLVKVAGEQGVALVVHAYTLTPQRFGASFLLGEPLGQTVLATVKSILSERDPELSLMDFSLGTETRL